MRYLLSYALILSCFYIQSAVAANLNPPFDVGSPGSAMYSINAIYHRLDSGAQGQRDSGFIEPEFETGTVRTLNEVMERAPVIDANAATPADVKAGKTFWGLRQDSWGLQTGTSSIVNP